MKLKDILRGSLKDWSAPPTEKRWSGVYSNDIDSGLTEFERRGGKDFVNEASMNIGKGKYANIYDMKKEIKEGKFDPKNPTIAVTGLGVYSLKTLEKNIQRNLKGYISDLGYESGARNLDYHLFSKYAPTGSKIKGLWEVYQQMNSPAYKRAVTIYKRKR